MRSKQIPICSTLALATALLFPSGAGAQSFQGNGVVGSGTATIATGPGTTTVTVGSPQSVINWTPTDNAVGTGTSILFQPADTTATFTTAAGSNLTDFAVLNRIIPADTNRQIVLDGNILSNLQGSASQSAGTVFFYSPSGIVVGASAVIDVGNLGLTTADPLVDGNGNWMAFGPSGERTVEFRQSLSGKSIVTDPGSSIRTLGQGSYVAMVAPRVQHGGTITTSGQAALVAAEAATINFSPDGLFDIQVSVGTTDSFGVINSGTIIGGASSGGEDLRRIYMVAVPKNSALTMTFQSGSSLGFDVAGAASVDGNAVVLSAGHDVTDGVADSGQSGAAGGSANILVEDSRFSSAVTARATGGVHISGNGLNSFASDLIIRAGGDIALSTSGASGALTVAGTLLADSSRAAPAEGEDATAGSITLSATGGSRMRFGQGVYLYADGSGGSSGTAGLDAGTGAGGAIGIAAETGGEIAFGGALFASSSGYGGFAGTGGIRAGDGAGGTIGISVSGGSAIAVDGDTTLVASGVAGSSGDCFSCGVTGGEGRGGAIRVTTSGDGAADLSLASIELSASGRGGAGDGGPAGAGLGGTVEFVATGTGSTIRASDVTMVAIGSGGDHADGGSGGAGAGGTITFGTSNSTASLAAQGPVEASADGFGGASFGADGIAGQGAGGTVTASNAGVLDLAGSFFGSAAGHGGFASGGAAGGAGAGGASLFSAGGQVSVAGDVELDAGAEGGQSDQGTGGDATGGQAAFAVSGESTATLGADLSLSAVANGGDGSVGGNATGGSTALKVEGATALLNDVRMTADATGGAGSAGTGGNAIVGGSTILVTHLADDLTRRGSLQADEIILGAVATGGAGTASGSATSLGGNRFAILNGDAALGSVSILVNAADGLASGGSADSISIRDGSATVSGAFAVTTDGTLSLLSETGGDLSAASIGLSAADFVGDPAVPSPAGPGTFTAGHWSVDTGNDFVAGANLRSDSGFALSAPGSIRIIDLAAAGPVSLIATGGDVLLRNATLASGLQVQAAGNLTASQISATSIVGTARGLALITGAWAAPRVELRSGDVDITGTGGITAGPDGLVRLTSLNTQQTLIGDGLDGSGYALSNAEFNRLSGGRIDILAVGSTASTVDMLIGDLSIGASVLQGFSATLAFGLGNLATNQPGGTIRVIGAITGSSFNADQAVRLTAGLIEIDASTASISLSGAGGALSGRLELTADNIRLAEGEVLSRLLAEPQYAGREEDLNAPAAVQRPDGVVRAGAVTANARRSFIVQNMGTAETPAGILTGDLIVTAGPNASPGGVELIINGQLQRPAGLLTRLQVLDALLADARFDASAFSTTSTVNGCKVDGSGCRELPRVIVPLGDIRNEIRFNTDDPLGDKLFPDEGDLPGGPIGPPERLVDTRPLGPDRDVEEPVTGSGNPALIDQPRSRPGDGE